MSENPSSKSVSIRLIRQLSHDLKTPIATLINTSDLFATGVYGDLTEKQQKAVERMQRSGHRAVTILDDFMVYAKAEADEYPIVYEELDLRQLINELLDEIRDIAKSRNIILENSISETVPAKFISDRNIIRRIILALLWNSVAATENGTISVLANWSSSIGCTISVKDTGIGIPASDAERIFEIFWKGKSQAQPLGSGCGIGLAMARALALLMKGNLSLVTSSTQGSTFDLHIPQYLLLSSDATNLHD